MKTRAICVLQIRHNLCVVLPADDITNGPIGYQPVHTDRVDPSDLQVNIPRGRPWHLLVMFTVLALLRLSLQICMYLAGTCMGLKYQLMIPSRIHLKNLTLTQTSLGHRTGGLLTWILSLWQVFPHAICTLMESFVVSVAVAHLDSVSVSTASAPTWNPLLPHPKYTYLQLQLLPCFLSTLASNL